MPDLPSRKLGPPPRTPTEGAPNRPLTLPPGKAPFAPPATKPSTAQILEPLARTDCQAAQAPASGLSRILGLLLVLTAAYLGTADARSWNARVSWVENTIAQFSGPADDGQAAPSPTVADDDLAEPAVSADAPQVRQRPWLWLSLVLVATICALSMISSKPASFLLTAALIGLTACCASALLDRDLPWRPVVFCATVLAYIIHSAPRPAATSLRGVVGLILVVLGAWGAARGWFHWGPLVSRIGTPTPEFVSHWDLELMWLTALLITFLGVFVSRTRPIHFFIVVLLLALAYHCVVAGRIEIREFPELSPPGKLITAVDDSFSNVEAWRWVVAVELILISAVLLHKSMGVGSLNLAFALAWMFLGCTFYDSIRTASLARLWSDLGTSSGVMSDVPTRPGNSSSLQPLANWGLPLAATTVRSAATSSRQSRSPSATNPASPARPSRQMSRAPPTDQELAAARQAALVGVRQVTWREIVLPVWIYLTAILAGLIAITGLNVLSAKEAGRTWMSFALWLALGIGLAAAWFAYPKEPTQSWVSWFSDWTQSKYNLHVVWLIFLGTAAIAGSWALRPQSHPDSWMRVSIVCAFAGTILSLIGVAVLIYCGGFAPLPVWTYAAIAAGQSSLAWVLMMYLDLPAMSRPVPASTS